MNTPFEECSSQLRPKYWALEIFHELEKRMHKILKCAVVAAAIAVMMMATTTLTFAQSNIVGTYTVADNGQGGWAGGPLYANGILGGTGAVSFNNGQEVGKVVSGTWQVDSSVAFSALDICFTIQPVKDPLNILSGTVCFGPIPQDSQPHKISTSDGTTLVMVSLH